MLLIVQEIGHGAGDALAVLEGHEDATVLGQQLFGMPVRRRNDRLAAAESIAERAGSRLFFDEIGGEIDVGSTDELFELLKPDEAVVKGDVLTHAQFFSKALQPQSVAFTLHAQQVRMGRTKHDVDEIRMLSW